MKLMKGVTNARSVDKRLYIAIGSDEKKYEDYSA